MDKNDRLCILRYNSFFLRSIEVQNATRDILNTAPAQPLLSDTAGREKIRGIMTAITCRLNRIVILHNQTRGQ